MHSPSPLIDLAPRATRLCRARPLLGTLVEISVTAPVPAAALHRAVDAAFAAISRVHDLMSYHVEDSDLSRLNRAAATRPIAVDAHTYRVIGAALEMARLGAGAFDPCVAPLLEASGHLPRHAAEVDPRASWRDIELLDGQRVRYHRPLRVDLGGIAKGYAVDVAVALLRQETGGSVVVNAGGDLRVAGAAAQEVQVRDAATSRAHGHRLVLTDQAIATSAGYFSRRAGAAAQRSALIDPRSRAASDTAVSVSVVAPDCMSADALTKIVLFAEPAVAQEALRRRHARAYLQQEDGRA